MCMLYLSEERAGAVTILPCAGCTGIYPAWWVADHKTALHKHLVVPHAAAVALAHIRSVGGNQQAFQFQRAALDILEQTHSRLGIRGHHQDGPYDPYGCSPLAGRWTQGKSG